MRDLLLNMALVDAITIASDGLRAATAVVSRVAVRDVRWKREVMPTGMEVVWPGNPANHHPFSCGHALLTYRGS